MPPSSPDRIFGWRALRRHAKHVVWHLRQALSRGFGRFNTFIDTWRGGALRPWVLRLPVLGWRKIRRELVQRHRRKFGQELRLAPPRGLNEIIKHRMIFDRDPRLRLTCDKIAVRRLIAETVGAQHAVPLIGAWRDARDIPWKTLPLPVVIKPSQASGAYRILRRIDDKNLPALVREAERWLRIDYFDRFLEWAYRGLPRRVIAEPLIVSPDGSALIEVEVFVLAGRAAVVLCATGRKNTPGRCAEWYDRAGQQLDLIGRAPYIDTVLTPAQCARFRRQVQDAFPAAIDLAERAARGFALLRVDIYLSDGGLRIGELTPYPAAGGGTYQPAGWDERLGQQFFEHLAQARRLGLRFPPHWPPADWAP